MDSNGTKPWWTSKTIWTALAALICAIAGALGTEVSDTDAAAAGSGLAMVASGVFSLLSIIGRLTAKKRIG